jgi:hypothetical protein
MDFGFVQQTKWAMGNHRHLRWLTDRRAVSVSLGNTVASSDASGLTLDGMFSGVDNGGQPQRSLS